VFNPVSTQRGSFDRIELSWPAEVPDGGRHGFLDTDNADFDAAVAAAAAELATRLDPNRPVVVVGHEELMYLPLRVAADLDSRGLRVRFQTTTRSPAHVLDDEGYPLRRGFRFVSPEGSDDQPRHLYNALWPGSNPMVVVVLDGPADTTALASDGGLLDVLAAADVDVLAAIVGGADPARLRTVREGVES
jgi:hypothetical protein